MTSLSPLNLGRRIKKKGTKSSVLTVGMFMTNRSKVPNRKR